ncbi:HAD family phosphatase [Nonomuraea sp. NPDC003804]|uniref:HAD family hydrolase n=1 Tax=Nonomuraea sp. NPDC003804 TaxID=3154547 RepID=UPI0033A574CF
MSRPVVFDLDGVLVDSEPVWEEVRRAYVAAHGGTWLPETQSRLMGMSTSEWAAYLAELGVRRSPDEIAAGVVGLMAERYRHGVPLMPGAKEAVARLAEHRPLGLASSSPRALIDVVLDATGLGAFFSATVSTEEVAYGKPAPDGYLEAARRLGADPRGCVAVEDSSNGLRSAAAAGMRVIAVPHPRYPPAPDALELAAAVVPALGDLTPVLVDRLA